MKHHTILIADNDTHFAVALSPLLQAGGYGVIEAHTLDEERCRFQEPDTFDLIIQDIHMVNQLDERDFSGLGMTGEAPNGIPVIIATEFPTFMAAREALKAHLNGASLAVDFIAKQDGIDGLLFAVQQAYWKIDAGAEEERNNMLSILRNQASVLFWISVIAIVGGLLLFVVAVMLAFAGRIDIAAPGAIGGVFVTVIGGLVFNRVDGANRRFDTRVDKEKRD